jgi:hypothetical protein
MAMPRKEALKHLRGHYWRVLEHLEKIATKPNDRDVPHWAREVRGWLRTMEEYLPHVGKKTAAEWQGHIDTCRSTIDR